MTVPALRIVYIAVAIVTLLLLPHHAFAQTLSGGQIATNLEVSDSDAAAGDILSITTENTLTKASGAYDQNLFGVVAEDPAVVLNAETDTTKPIVSEGEVQVKVSTANGNIEVGDLITSSDEPGVGQKASEDGVVIGKALASFSDSTQGTIPVLINIEFNSLGTGGGSFEELWNKVSALTSVGLSESDSFQLLLRYLFALILGLISFTLGFYFAARAIRTGLVAIGRNPLAKNTIQAGMFFNLFTVIILSMSGVGLSLFIIFYR